MTIAIRKFQGETRWLSNFHEVEVELDGVKYPSVEHAYQAAKTLNPEERQKILACDTPGKAKRAGMKVTLRPDWEEIKVSVMLDLTQQKFEVMYLEEYLLETGDALLVEGNSWGDVFWGVDEVTGEGQNNLGKILMMVRTEVRERVDQRADDAKWRRDDEMLQAMGRLLGSCTLTQTETSRSLSEKARGYHTGSSINTRTS